MPSVERVRWAKFRTAMVSFAAFLILGVLFYLLAGSTFFQPKSTIYLYIPDATGIDRDSPVRVNGITVGKVTGVALSGLTDPRRVVRVTIELPTLSLSGLPADSTAELGTETLIGDKFVDINSGTSRDALRPGGELAFKEDVDIMKNLDMTQLEARLRQVDETLTEIEQGTSRVGRFVQGEEVYKSALRKVAEVQGELRRAATATEGAGKFLHSDEELRQISNSLRQLDQGLALLRSGQGDLGRILRDPAQYEKWRADLATVRRGVAEIRASEFLQSDRMYANWMSAVGSFIKAVDEFNAGPASGTAATYENLTGKSAEIRDTVKDFRENPKKYLRLKVF